MLSFSLALVLTVCGDGRIDTVPQQQCAPCMPGNECPCSTFEMPTEACDGKNLGGKTCVGLGFLGGALSCSKTCEVDTTRCWRTKAPGRDVTPGAFGDVAITPTEVAVVTSTRRVLTLEVFSRKNLVSTKSTSLPLPVKADGANGIGELRVAAAKDGWVVAGQRYGSASELRLWHVRPDGTWEDRGVARGQRPLFFVQAGDELALGGETWAPDSKSVGVTVTMLSSDGTPGESRVLPAPDRRFTGNSASAAFFGGAVHVLSTCNPNQPNSPVRLDGAPLDLFGGAGVLAADEGGAQALVVHEGLWRLRFDGSGKPTDAPKKVSEPVGRVVSAAVVGGVLEAWLHRGGVLTRLRLPKEGPVQTEDLVSGMNFEVLAVQQGHGATFTLTSAGGTTTLHQFEASPPKPR
ncbi:MAG: hypothetical protein SFW67_19100 [Myxococcaceae bacterium]|nr:hypothetical protein [Myxococcaceae bacterium]